MTYRPASDTDRSALLTLLTHTHLKTDDLPTELGTFLLALSDEGDLIGAAGIEPLGEVGVLRSVAVIPDQRGQYIGQTLVDGLIQAARYNGLSDLYLLTTTADAYFERLGFERISYDEVPEVVKQTQPSGALAPDLTIAMRYSL